MGHRDHGPGYLRWSELTAGCVMHLQLISQSKDAPSKGMGVGNERIWGPCWGPSWVRYDGMHVDPSDGLVESKSFSLVLFGTNDLHAANMVWWILGGELHRSMVCSTRHGQRRARRRLIPYSRYISLPLRLNLSQQCPVITIQSIFNNSYKILKFNP